MTTNKRELIGKLPDETPTMEYPTSVNIDGFVDERACERLGLGAQWKQAVIEDRDMLLVLSGAGEMLIRPPGEDTCVLNFKETAALIVFMNGDNTKRLFPAILRASLLAQGGKVAELAEWMEAAFKKEEAALPPVDDEPMITLVDDGQRSGVKLERHDWPSEGRMWLEFSAGRSPTKEDEPIVSVDVNLGSNARPGIELSVDGHFLNGYVHEVWTLADLRQLHTAIGKLLADERLLGALSEQHTP